MIASKTERDVWKYDSDSRPVVAKPTNNIKEQNNSNNKINVVLDSMVISIGRASDNDIILNDKQISRYHAKIEVRGNVIKLIDDKSINGTYVNGEKIISSKKITGNEKIQLGKISLDWKLIKTVLEKPVISAISSYFLPSSNKSIIPFSMSFSLLI